MSPRLTCEIALALSASVASAGLAQQQLAKSTSGDEPPRIDSADISDHARALQASFEIRRRRMLPRFSIGTVDQSQCLIVGRFCEYHPDLRDYKIPDEGREIVRARKDR